MYTITTRSHENVSNNDVKVICSFFSFVNYSLRMIHMYVKKGELTIEKIINTSILCSNIEVNLSK